MGCIDSSMLKDKNMTDIIVSNKSIEEIEEKKDYFKTKNIHLYSTKKNLYFPKINTPQDIEELIDNNPLPFVKIKRKHLY